MIITQEEKVIHPEKVMDVDFIVRKLVFDQKLRNCIPSVTVLGAGTTNSYFRDFRFDRELHRIISLFKFKGLPLENIITLDIDRDICKEWSKFGITTFNGNWFDRDIILKIKDKLKHLENGRWRNRILYANTHGALKEVALYQDWLNILNPKFFLGLYAFRGAFSIDAVKHHMNSLKEYYPYDLDFGSNKGLITYNNICISIMRKKGFEYRSISGRR